jgi:O-antigen/teichoic acid export membrane protein
LKQYGITYDKKQLIGVNKYCFPVYKYNIYSWVIIYANNYLILFLDKTTKVLGVFDFTMKCTLIIEVFQNSFCSTINPKIYEIWGAKRIDLEAVNEEYQYHKLFTILNILFIAISIFAIPLVGELIIKKREYIAYFKFLPFMLISFIFRPLLNIYTNCAYFFNNTKALPKMIVISAVIQIIIMYLTFPYIGVWAAIISSFAARLIQVIVLKLITKEKLFITTHKIELLFIPLFYLVLIFGLFSTNKISYFSASCIQLFLSIFITLFYAKSFFNIQLFKKKTLVSDKMNKDED